MCQWLKSPNFLLLPWPFLLYHDSMKLPKDEWADAACRNPESKGDSPYVMFPEGQGGRKAKEEKYAIKTYCRNCPLMVFQKCRELGKTQPHGIWGGETEEDRRLVYGYLRLLT